MGGWWIARGGPGGRLIEIDEAQPLTARFQVDINKADWPELIQLPGIGPTLAKRIVDSRRTAGPFADQDDLRRVARHRTEDDGTDPPLSAADARLRERRQAIAADCEAASGGRGRRRLSERRSEESERSRDNLLRPHSRSASPSYHRR